MDTFILDSELSFRKYILSNSNKIMKIYLTLDELDSVIYFYCFADNLIVSTKEFTTNFDFYLKIYNDIYKLLGFNTFDLNKNKTIKLIR